MAAPLLLGDAPHRLGVSTCHPRSILAETAHLFPDRYTSCPRQKFCSGGSCIQRPPGEGPFERFGEHRVEVIDEASDSIAQVFNAGEARSFQQSSRQNAEPNFDLIEPGAMPRRVDETDAMIFVLQKLFASCHRFENPSAPFSPKVLREVAQLGDEFHETG